MYLSDLYKERKTYLTTPEEEELIRRLYTCPKVNIFPPRLYEDLPPLKFWSSPASVIESYLLRKVFQKRLQLAYEFNQGKESGSNDTEDSAKEAQKQLTQALVQLTSDMNYFQHLASQQVLEQAQQREIESVQKSYEFQNKANWEKIWPEEEVAVEDDSLLEASEVMLKETQHQERLSRDIKNRYITYKDFYRLQNISQRDKEPLAVTINQAPQKSVSTSYDSPRAYSVCFNEANYPTKWSEIKKSSSSKKVTLTNASGPTSHKFNRPDSIVSFGTDVKKIIPQNFEMERKRQAEESVLPSFSTNSIIFDNFSRKGTLLTMRDSFELNQKRLSSVSKPGMMRKNKSKISYTSFASHRDSYMMIVSKRLDRHKPDFSSSLSNSSLSSNYLNKFKKSSSFSTDYSPSSLADHRDSIELATDRKVFKQKSSIPLTCDICYNDSDKPVQFTCNLHSELCSLKLIPKHNFSIVSTKKPSFKHKDSLEVIPKTFFNKEKCISKETQAQSLDILKDTLPTNVTDESPLHLVSVVKGSQKSKLFDKPTEQGNISVTPSKLNLYLMKSMNVNQIVLDDNNKPIS